MIRATFVFLWLVLVAMMMSCANAEAQSVAPSKQQAAVDDVATMSLARGPFRPSDQVDAGSDALGDADQHDVHELDAAHVDVAMDAVVSLNERARQLRELLGQLAPLAKGSLPNKAYITDLFPFNLTDERAVALGRRDLEAFVATARLRLNKLLAQVGARVDGGVASGAGFDEADRDGAPGAVDASGYDASDTKDKESDARDTDASLEEFEETEASVLTLEVQVANARLAFLDLPADKREELLAKDAENRRVSMEQEKANVERERALAEQHRAEAARQKALAEAERARDELARVIANEQARMEGVFGSQAVYRRELAERRQAWATQSAEQQSKLRELEKRLSTVRSGTEATNQLFDDFVAEQERVLSTVRVALNNYLNVPKPAQYTFGGRYEAFRDKVPQATREQIDNGVTALSDAARDMYLQARSLAWDTLEAAVQRENALVSHRLKLLEVVTPAKRSAVLGFGKEGIVQLRREMQRVEVEARWYVVRSQVRLRSIGDWSKDPLWVGQVTWLVLVLLGLFAGVLVARGRGPNVIRRLRATIVKSVRTAVYAKPLTALMDALDAVWSLLVIWLAVWFARDMVGDGSYGLELAVVVRLLFWYATYRLVIVAFHRLLYAVIRRSDAVSSKALAQRSERLARSVRMVARYAFAVAFILIMAAEVLGRGYLYHVVARFAWFGAIPIFALLVRWWRSDIAETYLAHYPDGRLASLVKSTRHKWFGFFVATMAFVVVLGQATAQGLRHFVLRFEQTRKALAFLFRRRLERKAAESPKGPAQEHLPEDLRQWFSHEPVSNEAYVVQDIAGLTTFDDTVDKWRNGGMTTPIVVVGTGGMGKSSWLNLAANRTKDAKIVRIAVDSRVITEQQVIALLADGMGVQVDAQTSVSQLIDAINAVGRCIILIDDVHHLVLRGVDVFDGWDAFVRVVDATRKSCLWVATMCGWTYQYLSWARGAVEPFRTLVKLERWSEEKVGRLISERARRSGYEMDYEDLVVDKLEGVEGEAQLVSTREGYMRLIWDYADGCPVIALHCWRGSLVYDGPGSGESADGSDKYPNNAGGGDKRVRVRLFQRPDVNELESLNDIQRFVLASIIWHGTLTPQQASQSLNISLQYCSFAFNKLHEVGIIERERERSRVVAGWLGPVTRFLFRKHLIEE